MKKISLLLTLVMLFSMIGLRAFAKDEVPVTAEYSYTENGDIEIVVFTNNVKKLVSLNVVLSYDINVYKLQSASACGIEDANGNVTENLTGLWVFGELSDKTGCTGAFISFNGVTKNGKTPACQFVIRCEKGEASPADITVAVKELITDDGNEENDIYKNAVIPLGKENLDSSAEFTYSVNNENVIVTGVKVNSDVCFVPDTIQGLPVRGMAFEEPFQSPFIVFGRNVLKVSGNAFSKNNIVIAPADSAPAAAAKRSGVKALSYTEDVTTGANENVFYTHKYLATNTDEMFLSDCNMTITPSHKAFEKYLGTGTKFTLESNGKTAEFLLCVTGDANGDSVCDVLDAVMVKAHTNKQTDLEKIQQKSVDFNSDGVVDVNDYAQSVNVALGEEIKVFDGIWGDLNGDYCVDILDLFQFNKFMNNTGLSEEEKTKADFNNDGIVDKEDKEILNELVEEFK